MFSSDQVRNRRGGWVCPRCHDLNPPGIPACRCYSQTERPTGVIGGNEYVPRDYAVYLASLRPYEVEGGSTTFVDDDYGLYISGSSPQPAYPTTMNGARNLWTSRTSIHQRYPFHRPLPDDAGIPRPPLAQYGQYEEFQRVGHLPVTSHRPQLATRDLDASFTTTRPTETRQWPPYSPEPRMTRLSRACGAPMCCPYMDIRPGNDPSEGVCASCRSRRLRHPVVMKNIGRRALVQEEWEGPQCNDDYDTEAGYQETFGSGYGSGDQFSANLKYVDELEYKQLMSSTHYGPSRDRYN
ncbi:hypothetical protein CALCODRAFT_79397 [Calocera cornea HHB12733]|uniref:RanBP2-type domain-containing protein n=1 Tax=Calocera cornea HHB12733 TaxID=1353952 RepID=A0A165DF81_9BASI|nr:hypothetical protein CALCODRAFT_79397 [Calocera cornea HHB12733]